MTPGPSDGASARRAATATWSARRSLVPAVGVGIDVVLGLDEQTRGDAGHYGLADDASAAIPEAP